MDMDEMDKLRDYISKRFDELKEILDRMINIRSVMNGDELLDNHDLCKLLRVTKRTLQRYRKRNLLPFYKIDGRMYYKKSEVMEFFKNHNPRKKDPMDDP